jgi:hypothetical protein
MDRADSDRPGPLASGPAQTIDRAGSAVAAGGVGAAVGAPVRGPDAGPGGGGPGGFGWWRVSRVVRGPVAVQLAVLAGFAAAGIAVSWPRVTYLAGRLPATRDAGSYVWGFWWVARQVEHLGNPWFTRYIDAPAGAQLGLHALMPLPGVVMMPVTVVFGPSASYNLLSIVMPGLLCYAMYRVARLWLPSQAGAIAAGAFFGLSSMLTWRSWYHLNLAAGALFLPLALEAAVRLTRRPGWRRAVVLGVVVGGALLTDQEMAVLVVILACAALVPWLVRRPVVAKLWPAALAGLVTLLVGSPQLIAIAQQTRSGGATIPKLVLGGSYLGNDVIFPRMFELSPRVTTFGLHGPPGFIYGGRIGDGIPTYGLVLSVLAVAGLLAAWRRRSAWLLALLWLGCAVMALGPVIRVGNHIFVPDATTLDGVRVSAVMPYTWFVRIPGLSGFREPARILMLGLVPAALLAGAAVNWLRYHAAALLIPVLVLAALETGWPGNVGLGTMPTARPAVDGPIAADHSSSIVVDVPFGIRGGVPLPDEGDAFDPESEVLATADGHPRAIGYLSRLPVPTLAAIRRHAFYAGLLTAQGQPLSAAERDTGTTSDAGLIAAALQDARRMNVGWVIVWHRSPDILRYLARTGFRLDYSAGGVLVYRPVPAPRTAVR